jgi:hypothetical protein
MGDLLMWQEEFLEKVCNMCNVDLLEFTLELARGDDHDGEFTGQGYWKYHCCLYELQHRLKGITGWLERDLKISQLLFGG